MKKILTIISLAVLVAACQDMYGPIPVPQDPVYSAGIDVQDETAIYAAMSLFREKYLVHEEDYIGPYEYNPFFPTFEHSRSIDEQLEHGYKWLGYFMIYADNDLIERLVNEGALIAKLEPAENNGFYYRLPEELVFEDSENTLFEQICKDYFIIVNVYPV